MTFDFENLETQEEVREHIQECEGKHVQQAIYSTFHDGLTQICFGCRCIRSTIKVIIDRFILEHKVQEGAIKAVKQFGKVFKDLKDN